MAPVETLALTRVEYAKLFVALPGQAEQCAGVLVLEPSSGRAEVRFQSHWEGADPEDARILEAIEGDLTAKAQSMGGARLFEWLEDSLSHTVRIAARDSMAARDLTSAADQLYARFAASPRRKQIIPFRTHVPVLSMKAAATKFGEDLEVSEEGWVELPAGQRPDERLFVAQVVGRSMEPKIPDGSYCLFRAGVTGTRQGKLLLIRHRAGSAYGGEYTIKRYRSEKTLNEEGWEHARIRLEPINPEFEAWDLDEEDEFQVIGEFVSVLGHPEIEQQEG